MMPSAIYKVQLLILGTPGRGAKEANLYTEIAEGIHSYGVTRHRHGKDSNSKPSCMILSCSTAKLT